MDEPTTEDHGLDDEVLLVVVDLAVELLGEALEVVAGLVVLMLVEFPEQRRDPLLFFAKPQSN